MAREGLVPRRVTGRPGPEQPGQWEPWPVALDAQIAAEDRQDRQARASQRRLGFPEPERDIPCFEGFASAGATPRRESRRLISETPR